MDRAVRSAPRPCDSETSPTRPVVQDPATADRCHCGSFHKKRVMRAYLGRGSHWIVRCMSCGQLRTDPFPYRTQREAESVYSEDKSDFYDRHRLAFHSWGRLLLEELQRVGNVRRLLDVGCGPGLMVE